MEENNTTTSMSTAASVSPKRNYWVFVSLILAVGLIVAVYSLYYGGGINSNVIKGDVAGKKLVDFLNVKTGGGVEYLSYVDKGNIYEVTVNYQNQKIPVFITKDGTYFVQGAVPLVSDNSSSPNNPQNSQTPKDVPKADKPKAELFVMTYCPYGLQAEKGFIPAMKALSTKADTKIRFVHYFMHGDKEEAETYTQVCIREEQSDKYLNYLSCFTGSGDSAACRKTASIDEAKLNVCLSNNATKAKEYYDVDKKLSEQYGVQGSPTLIVNGVESSSGRSADAFGKTICGAFNSSPADCKTLSLSTENPGAGFGASATAGSPTTANGGCASA